MSGQTYVHCPPTIWQLLFTIFINPQCYRTCLSMMITDCYLQLGLSSTHAKLVFLHSSSSFINDVAVFSGKFKKSLNDGITQTHSAF